MQETWVQSLGREDSLEKEMAARSSTLSWEISWTEEPSGLLSWGHKRVRHDLVTQQQQSHIVVHLWCTGKVIKIQRRDKKKSKKNGKCTICIDKSCPGHTGSCLPKAQCSARSTADGPVVRRQHWESHPPRWSEGSELQQAQRKSREREGRIPTTWG